MNSRTSRVMTTDPEMVPTSGINEPRKAMKASNAEYFTGNPTAGKMSVKTIKEAMPLTSASEP